MPGVFLGSCWSSQICWPRLALRSDGYGLFMLPLELIRLLRVPTPKWVDRFDTTTFGSAKLLCVARKEAGCTAGARLRRDDQPVQGEEERREPAYASAGDLFSAEDVGGSSRA
jgi:hypothetical protein